MKVYIGYDSSNYGQEIAYQVCKRSIKNYNKKIQIKPIKLRDLRYHRIYTRPHDEKQSTEFTYSRFLTPYLSNYEGYCNSSGQSRCALFCDSDFLWRCDIEEVLGFIDDRHSVSCVHHEYAKCPNETKMDGLKQEWYPRKNWSSLMLFNCAHEDCGALTPGIVNSESPKYLHRMEWTSDGNIGSIPLEYNHLVGYYSSENPKALHFTDGGPWHEESAAVDYSEEWLGYLTKEETNDYNNGLFWAK